MAAAPLSLLMCTPQTANTRELRGDPPSGLTHNKCLGQASQGCSPHGVGADRPGHGGRAHQERSVWGRTGTAREPADTGPHPIMHAQVRDGGEARSAAGVWLVCVHAGACTSLHVLRGAGAAATAGGSGALPTREMEERRQLLHTHHDYPTPLVESGTSSAVGGADGLPAARKGKEDVMVTNGTRRLC